MTFPVMPLLHGYSINKRPTFASIVQVPRSGRDVTAAQQSLPLWEFELRYEVLRDETQNSSPDTYFSGYTELQQIAGLYAACAGEYGFFYFNDLSDNSRTQQWIGTGNGTTTAFRLLRTITYGGSYYTEPVGGINENESIVVYVNDVAVPQSGNWNISADLRYLVFDSPPASDASIKITFYYYYFCRFITNEAEFEEFLYDRWTQKGLRFRSVNAYTVGDTASWLTNPLTPPVSPPAEVLPAGKYYWEVTIDQGAADSTGGYGLLSGVGTSAVPLVGTVGTSVNIPQGPGGAFISWRANNPVSPCTGWGSPTRMGGIPGGEPLTTGEKIAFALDTVNHKLWVRNVSRNIPATGWGGGSGTSGDPATNLDGANLVALGLSGNLYVICGVSHGAGSNHAVGTINFGASSFTGTVPSGFSSIFSAYASAALAAGPANPFNPSVDLIVRSGGNLTFSGENVPVTFSPPEAPISVFTTNVGYCCSTLGNFAIAQA